MIPEQLSLLSRTLFANQPHTVQLCLNYSQMTESESEVHIATSVVWFLNTWLFLVNQTYNYSFVLKKHWTWEGNTWKEKCRTSSSTETDDTNRVCVPWVPLDLLFVGEFEEVRADSGRCPGAHAVKEPLESAKTHHRDEQDQLAEGVHGHPTPLQEKEQKKTLEDTNINVLLKPHNGKLTVPGEK